ncbi:MAG: RNA polymerase factor sigma-54 [Saprospiraceae bacterium]
MLKQNLSQKMMQKLSPQQIQLMKLLQIPTSTLDQRIKEELEANPALEEGDEDEEQQVEAYAEAEAAELAKEEEDYAETPSMEDVDEGFLNEVMDDDRSIYDVRHNSNPDEEDRSIPIAVQDTFHDYLENQIGMLNLTDERQGRVAFQIVGSIDDDGYLRRDPEAIVDDLVFSQNVETNREEVLELLSRIQKFDPPGVGARSLQECLMIQLDTILADVDNDMDDVERTEIQLARRIVKDYFEEFTKKHYQKLQRGLSIGEDQLRDTIDQILKLNPKPASGFSTSSSRSSMYVVPDFIIENRDGELELTLNSRNAPELRVSDHYREMLSTYKDHQKAAKLGNKKMTGRKKNKEAVLFIKQKIDSAKWFIDAIRQRQETMYKTMYTIMQYQYEYFRTGDDRKLRPMILKDIADITGLDISTVSRVANSKFVQTEYGTKRLKQFFSESLTTESGEEVSTLEVKKILKDIIEAEHKRKPLSDEKLKNMLCEKGYNIARRTVAKYREQLGIPVARLRKEL